MNVLNKIKYVFTMLNVYMTFSNYLHARVHVLNVMSPAVHTTNFILPATYLCTHVVESKMYGCMFRIHIHTL